MRPVRLNVTPRRRGSATPQDAADAPGIATRDRGDEAGTSSEVLTRWSPRLRVGLDVFLLLVFTAMMWQSKDWPNLVKVIPLTVGAIGAILSTCQLVADATAMIKKPLPASVRQVRDDSVETTTGDEDVDAVTVRDMGVSLAAMLMFLALIVLLGFAMGGAVASVVYLRGFRHQNLLVVVAVAASLYIAIAVGFEYLLQVSLPPGMLLP